MSSYGEVLAQEIALLPKGPAGPPQRVIDAAHAHQISRAILRVPDPLTLACHQAHW